MKALLDRFLAQVNATEGCWLWTGALNRGRAVISIKADGKWQTRFAYRVAWELYRGESPGEMLVCHHCDNPACVRPDHLFLGTQADNIRDASEKGRLPLGAARTNAKLSGAQVIAIRRSSLPIKAIARQFGVSPKTIRNARSVRTYAKIGED